MIIDLILDRKDGLEYKPKQFYDSVTAYGEIGFGIASALDSGEESDIKRELARYIVENDYNLGIIEYVNRVNWL